MVSTSTLLLITAATGLVLPVLSALVSRAHWDSSITGLLTGLFAAATGFVGEWANAGTGFDVKSAALAALAAWLTGTQLTQRGVLSGTQVEARLLNVGGGSSPVEDPTVGLDYDEPTTPDAAA